MDNSFEELMNSTLSSPLMIVGCLKANIFSYIFIYPIKLVCAILGTAAHFWCLQFYLCRPKYKFKPAHVFFVNYTIMELIYCLECLPEIINEFIFKNYLIYQLFFFFFALSFTGRPLVQASICIEQYLAVLHPLTFLRYKDIKYRIAVVAVSWFIAIAYSMYSCDLQKFPDSIFNCIFFIAVAVISFCFLSVLYALKQSSKRISSQTGRYVGNQQTRKVFNQIFSALLITLLTYFPQVILSFFAIIKINKIFFCLNIVPFISFLNSCSVMITPLLKMYKEGHLKLNVIICRSVEQ